MTIIYIVIHNYSDGFQIEAFKEKDNALKLKREILDEYEKEYNRVFIDHTELNEYNNDLDITIAETELQ